MREARESKDLLGYLQRGLGRGWLDARDDPQASRLVLACVRSDPRWDRQIERRAAYYAGVGRTASLAPAELLAESSRTDPVLSLPAAVLVEMALRNVPGAMDTLMDALRGGMWREALCALKGIDLQRSPSSFDWPGLQRVLFERPKPELDAFRASFGELPGEEEAQAIVERRRALATWQPNPEASTEELIAAAGPGRLGPLSAILLKREDQDSTGLIRAAARGGGGARRDLALRVLGLQRDDSLCAEVADAIEHDRLGRSEWRAAAVYLARLRSAATLPLARSWIKSGDRQRHAATRIFREHALPEDRAAIEQALRDALASDELYSAYDLVEALARVADERSISLLVEIYLRARYSRIRGPALQALQMAGAAELRALAKEALWDCEPETRELAAQHCSLDEETRSRLSELASDTLETTEVRSAAVARLKQDGQTLG